MKRMVWMLGLLVLLPGCLNQKHYNEVMGTVDEVKTLKQNDQNQDRRIEHLEKVVKQLQSGLSSEIRTQGVKVEKSMAEGVRVTLPQAVLFASGSTEVNASGRKVLASVAKAALKDSKDLIRVVGYSDSLPVGKSLKKHYTDNWELSAARAAAVARVLVWGNGVAQDRIRVEGRGAVDPVASNATEKGRKMNRRIEIYIAG